MQKKNTIDDLLKNPFDLQKFKQIKKSSNSGGYGKKTYFYRPNQKGVYYAFFLFSPLFGYIGEDTNKKVYSEAGLEIVTFKPSGKYQYQYLDPTETLIQVIENFNDRDLPELAFVGIDTVKIQKKLGTEFIRADSCYIYEKERNALLLRISKGKVKWLKYVRLNMELNRDSIPSGLTKPF